MACLYLLIKFTPCYIGLAYSDFVKIKKSDVFKQDDDLCIILLFVHRSNVKTGGRTSFLCVKFSTAYGTLSGTYT